MRCAIIVYYWVFFCKSATRPFYKRIFHCSSNSMKIVYIAIHSLVITSLKRVVLGIEAQLPCHLKIYLGPDKIKFPSNLNFSGNIFSEKGHECTLNI